MKAEISGKIRAGGRKSVKAGAGVSGGESRQGAGLAVKREIERKINDAARGASRAKTGE